MEEFVEKVKKKNGGGVTRNAIREGSCYIKCSIYLNVFLLICLNCVNYDEYVIFILNVLDGDDGLYDGLAYERKRVLYRRYGGDGVAIRRE